MADRSAIQWTDATWNPVTGCTPIASGCKYCYAKEMHRRLRAIGSAKYQHDFSEVRCHQEDLDKPLRWRKSRRIFVNSMSDTFHKEVPFRFIADLFHVMCGEADAIGWHCRHTYQILTKRPDRMRQFFDWLSHREDEKEADIAALAVRYHFDPPKNIWLGVSASTQDDLDRNVPDLLATPAAVRFLSLEPLLEQVDLRAIGTEVDAAGDAVPLDSLTGMYGDGPWKQRAHLGWVIVGAESGPHRRYYRDEWLDGIVEQCHVAGVPVYVKQIHRDGKVVKMPAEYPQEYPK